jgi:hypothetical protein
LSLTSHKWVPQASFDIDRAVPIIDNGVKTDELGTKRLLGIDIATHSFTIMASAAIMSTPRSIPMVSQIMTFGMKCIALAQRCSDVSTGMVPLVSCHFSHLTCDIGYVAIEHRYTPRKGRRAGLVSRSEGPRKTT